jgi:lysophospholipase L1-like esterase
MMLRHCRDARWPVLVVGPPAVDDEAQNDRIAGLDGLFASLCQRRGVPYVSVLPTLRPDPTWRREVFEGDGAHPGSEGYALLADLVLPAWDAWLGGLFNGRWTAPWA